MMMKEIEMEHPDCFLGMEYSLELSESMLRRRDALQEDLIMHNESTAEEM
jgi:hypothetical protein